MSNNTPLSRREASFFSYLYKKMRKEGREYVNTNYGYIKNIAGYKNIPGARYLVKNLKKKKLIEVQESTNYKGRQYLRIKISKPKVVKKLFEAYKVQTSREREETSQRTEDVQKHSNETLSLNNINIINQINHSEGKKQTIVQDMLRAYNEEVEGTVTASRELAPLLVAAYKQKFKTVERWRRYVKHKVWGKIKDTFRFLKRILGFSIINAAMGEMGMSAEVPIHYTKEAAYNHVDTLKEAEVCLEIRRKFIERKGAGVYFSWLTKAALIEEGEKVQARGNSSFVTDWINTRYRIELERYYEEWKKNPKCEKVGREVKQESGEEMLADISVTGRVGYCDIKETERGKVLKMALSHEQSQKKDGKRDTQTVWYKVIYSGGKEIDFLKDLRKGDIVRALGSLCILQGKKQDGTPYTSFCILAKDVKRLLKTREAA